MREQKCQGAAARGSGGGTSSVSGIVVVAGVVVDAGASTILRACFALLWPHDTCEAHSLERQGMCYQGYEEQS